MPLESALDFNAYLDSTTGHGVTATFFEVQNSLWDSRLGLIDTWFDIYDTFRNKYSVTVATGKHSLPADVFKDVNKVRLKGAQNEASARTAKFLLIDILD